MMPIDHTSAPAHGPLTGALKEGSSFCRSLEGCEQFRWQPPGASGKPVQAPRIASPAQTAASASRDDPHHVTILDPRGFVVCRARTAARARRASYGSRSPTAARCACARRARPSATRGSTGYARSSVSTPKRAARSAVVRSAPDPYCRYRRRFRRDRAGNRAVASDSAPRRSAKRKGYA